MFGDNVEIVQILPAEGWEAVFEGGETLPVVLWALARRTKGDGEPYSDVMGIWPDPDNGFFCSLSEAEGFLCYRQTKGKATNNAYQEETRKVHRDPLRTAIIETLWMIYNNAELREKHMVNDEGVLVISPGRILELLDPKLKTTGKTIGTILRKEFGLVCTGRKSFGYAYDWDTEKMVALAKEYGVDAPKGFGGE